MKKRLKKLETTDPRLRGILFRWVKITHEKLLEEISFDKEDLLPEWENLFISCGYKKYVRRFTVVFRW